MIWFSIVVDELCVVVSTQNWHTLLTETLEEALRFLLSFPSYNFEFLSVLVLAVAMDSRDGYLNKAYILNSSCHFYLLYT